MIFLEDFLFYLKADESVIFMIKFLNFYIDIFFTLEFIIKMSFSLARKKGADYFIRKNGWADMFASLPLLFFITLPFFLKEVVKVDFSIIAVEYLVSLKVIRFFRILKLVGKIEEEKSPMISKHISALNLFISTSVILFFFIISFLQDADVFDSVYKRTRLKEIEISQNYLYIYGKVEEDKFNDILKSSLINFPEISLVKYKDNVFYNYDMEDINKNSKYFYYEDFVTENKFQIVFLRKNFYSETGFNSMVYFCLIFFIIFFINFFYKNYFYINIVKPVLIMKKGFEDINYITAVNIPYHRKNEEIFILSNNYNLRWLEAKKRKLNEIKKNGLTIKN